MDEESSIAFWLKLESRYCWGFEGGKSCQNSGTTKKILQKPIQGPLDASKSVQTKEGARFLPCVGSRNDPMARAAKTEVNQVVDSPLTVSTRRVEPITSKTMVSDEVPVLAKFRFEEGN